jgi:transcriptional regulator with XRE-family HTH domain
MEEKKPNTTLKRERELRGWSQQTVAERVNTTEQVVSRWESGRHKPNRYFQTQLCQLFGKSAEELGFMGMPQSKRADEQAQTITAREQIIEHSSPFDDNHRHL